MTDDAGAGAIVEFVGEPLDDDELLRQVVLAKIGYVAEAISDKELLVAQTDLVQAGTERKHTETRNWIAKCVFIVSLIAIFIAGLTSLITGAWAPVAGVWSVCGPLITWIVCFYFKPDDTDPPAGPG